VIDIEKFLISLRSNKDLDGKLKPIYLADTVQEEIKIIQAAVESSCREWVGLTDEERFKISRDTRPYIADTMRAHEEELKRRNT
jgi:hypothetical protein